MSETKNYQLIKTEDNQTKFKEWRETMNTNLDKIDNVLGSKANLSVTISAILLASGWSETEPYTQTIAVEGLTSELNGVVDVAQNITDEQLEAACNAELFISSQTQGSLIIGAKGEKPNIDIPIMVILLDQGGVMASIPDLPEGSDEVIRALLATKQDKLTGTNGQVVGFDATGNAVATNINLDVSNKQDKLSGSQGQFVGFNSAGNAVATNLDLSEKQDKLSGTQGQIVGFNAQGNAVASNLDLSSKQDKLSGTQGQIVGFNAQGNAVAVSSNITYGTSDLVAGTSPLADGTIYVVYEVS